MTGRGILDLSESNSARLRYFVKKNGDLRSSIEEWMSPWFYQFTTKHFNKSIDDHLGTAADLEGDEFDKEGYIREGWSLQVLLIFSHFGLIAGPADFYKFTVSYMKLPGEEIDCEPESFQQVIQTLFLDYLFYCLGIDKNIIVENSKRIVNEVANLIWRAHIRFDLGDIKED